MDRKCTESSLENFVYVCVRKREREREREGERERERKRREILVRYEKIFVEVE
jgi:hypothetical protein